MGESLPKESGAGRIKAFLTIASSVVSLVGGVMKLSDDGHGILSTLVFAFFAVYVVVDMLWWRQHPWVWVLGPITILVSAYWWVGFMALRGFPDQPLLPANLYPATWAYFAMASWLSLYAVWDIVDAMRNRYRDEQTLVAGAVVLIAGVCICLFLTVRGPLRV